MPRPGLAFTSSWTCAFRLHHFQASGLDCSSFLHRASPDWPSWIVVTSFVSFWLHHFGFWTQTLGQASLLLCHLTPVAFGSASGSGSSSSSSFLAWLPCQASLASSPSFLVRLLLRHFLLTGPSGSGPIWTSFGHRQGQSPSPCSSSFLAFLSGLLTTSGLCPNHFCPDITSLSILTFWPFHFF